jgi:uncharacterized protein
MMKTLEEIKGVLKKQKPFLKEKYGVSEIGIFGSYVRGEQRKKSDLDILVEFNKPIGLLKFVGLEIYLSEVLGIKVDLVMKGSLKPRIGKHILKEVVPL